MNNLNKINPKIDKPKEKVVKQLKKYYNKSIYMNSFYTIHTIKLESNSI